MEAKDIISTYDFVTKYFSESLPINFKGMCVNWGAMSKWSDEYLNNELGGVGITVSRYEYKNEDVLKKYIWMSNYTLNDFLNNLYNKTDPNYDYFWIDYLPEKLAGDLQIPDFINFLDLKNTKIWKGNGKSYTISHYERHEAFHCQIAGKSEIILSPSLDRNAAYPFKKNAGPPNMSGINIFNPNIGRFPNAGNMYKLYFILEPGDCMFIPSYWWRQVITSNEPNTYVTFLFESHSRYLDIMMKGLEEDKI